MKSKKVYLVFTSNSRIYPFLPSSSLALASELLKAGFEPVIVDTEMENWRAYDFSDALFVCISTFSGYWLKSALDVARKVRRQNPSAPVFWGGPHVLALPELTAKHELADAVCYGEGEGVIVELAGAVYAGTKDYSKIKGIMFRNEKGEVVKTEPAPPVDMDKVDLPPYELLKLDNYPIKSGRIYYQSSRGCVFKCRFCACEHGMKWRGRSADKVAGDLEKIVARFNPEELQFFDGNFFVSLERVREILRQKLAKKMAFKWAAFCRFDTLAKLDEATLKLLADSGCVELKLGGESASEKILEYIDKKIKPEQISEGVERCYRYGIKPTLSFMTGFPVETAHDLELTLNLMNELRKKYPKIDINGLFLFAQLPGTSLTEEVFQKYKIKRPEKLEDWIKYDLVWTGRDDYPWLTGREFAARRTLSSITSYVYFSNILLNLPEKQKQGTIFRIGAIFTLFKIFNKVMRGLVFLRWEKKILIFPVEWRVWDWTRRYVLRNC